MADLKYPVGIKDVIDCLILHIKHCFGLDLFCDFVRVKVQSIGSLSNYYYDDDDDNFKKQ